MRKPSSRGLLRGSGETTTTVRCENGPSGGGPRLVRSRRPYAHRSAGGVPVRELSLLDLLRGSNGISGTVAVRKPSSRELLRGSGETTTTVRCENGPSGGGPRHVETRAPYARRSAGGVYVRKLGLLDLLRGSNGISGPSPCENGPSGGRSRLVRSRRPYAHRSAGTIPVRKLGLLDLLRGQPGQREGVPACQSVASWYDLRNVLAETTEKKQWDSTSTR